MNDVLAEDALADAGGATATADPPEDEALQGYNPSDGEAPLEEQDGSGPEAEGAEAEEPETFPPDPDDTPAGPAPEEEEHEPTAEAEEQTIVEPSAEEPEPGLEPPAPAAEPEEEPEEEPVEEEQEEPEAAVEPPPAAPEPSQPKSKSRVYLVFEEHGREKKSYSQVAECLYTGAEQIKWEEAHKDEENPKPCPTGELRARNGDNALRAAYRRLSKAREDEDLRTTLVIVAQSSWRPKPIKPRQRNLPPALDIG
jgi:hypothetical protein